jgi:molecular chaperone DnaJ
VHAEAYAVLSNPGKRAEYDAGGFAGVAGAEQRALWQRLRALRLTRS